MQPCWGHCARTTRCRPRCRRGVAEGRTEGREEAYSKSYKSSYQTAYREAYEDMASIPDTIEIRGSGMAGSHVNDMRTTVS